jgi:phenylacetate-CoA ligase
LRSGKAGIGERGLSAPAKFDFSEPMSVDELRALQLARLRHSLRRACEQVPHYRAKFEAAGVHPGDFNGLADIARYPFTTKEDLRQNYPFGMFAVPMDDIVRLHVSSGTTGRPTVVGYTAKDIDIWATLMARSLSAAGVTPRDKVQIAFGYGLFTGGLGWHYGAERLGAVVIPVGGGLTERQVQVIRDFRPDVILATPSYLLVIADELERQGLTPWDCSLRIAIFGAEPCSEALRSEIERRLGVIAFDSYGLSEVTGPGVAQESAEARGVLTIWEDHFFPEIIDPKTGKVLGEGEEGELVLTTLTREGMPMIRYRTRDLTHILPREGGAMRRIGRIKGRSDDMLIIRGVNVFPSQIEAVLAQEGRLASHYVLEVRRPARLDELDVRVEVRAEFAGIVGAEEQRALARRAEHLIKAHVGVTANVRITPPGTIERSQGKAKRVIDLRPKE